MAIPFSERGDQTEKEQSKRAASLSLHSGEISAGCLTQKVTEQDTDPGPVTLPLIFALCLSESLSAAGEMPTLVWQEGLDLSGHVHFLPHPFPSPPQGPQLISLVQNREIPGPASWSLALSEPCSVSSVQFSRSAVSDSLRPHESQHTRPPCPSPTPGVHSDSRPSSQ